MVGHCVSKRFSVLFCSMFFSCIMLPGKQICCLCHRVAQTSGAFDQVVLTWRSWPHQVPPRPHCGNVTIVGLQAPTGTAEICIHIRCAPLLFHYANSFCQPIIISGEFPLLRSEHAFLCSRLRRFTTLENSGLLFYNGRFNEKHDFIALEIQEGQVVLKYSTGTWSVSLIK